MLMRRAHTSGFTLIEMVVSLAVLAILVVIAVPSFNEFRQRSSLRGAGDQIQSFWGDARFEALRRNSLVKVVFVDDASGVCLGAMTTDAADFDTDTCDCHTAADCNVGSWPSSQNEWRGVRIASAPTIGGDNDGLVIDPKRGALVDADDIGEILLQSSTVGSADYRLNVAFDRNGRAFLCEPADAPDKMPQYTQRRCAAAGG